MPATVTHAFFATDVFDILPEIIKSKLNIDNCKVFAQSMDACKFYNVLSLDPGEDIRQFSSYFHNNQSQEFFINLLTYIKDNSIDTEDVYSFLFGFICHYVLDSTLHPFIIYKTGEFDKKKPNTYKYNNGHHFMETFIDNDMIKRRFSINPYLFNITNFTFNICRFSTELNKTIDYTFYNTFQIKDMSKIYYKSLKQMRFFIKHFRQDKHGIKKSIYKFFDIFTSERTFKLEAISYHYPLDDNNNYLNSKRELWRNPTTYDMVSNESFIDLYLKAIKRAKIITCACFDFLNNKDIELDKIFDNSSYVTGLDCNLKKELKYFEF